MKRLFSLLIVMMMIVVSVPAFANDQSIVDIAVSNDDFSILVSALQEAELVGALQGEGPFTVFAPTNAAFADLLEALGIEAGDLLGHPQLAEVLLYHVVSGQVMSSDLSDGMEAPTLQGESLTVDLSMGVKINESSVVTADIEASNGVIHVIDRVLVPESFSLEQPAEEPAEPEADIVDIALSDENFSMLVMLLQRAELVEALQGEGPFTVFAPTNAAFESLLAALDISPSDLMAQPQLADVLLYHVVSGQVMSGDLSDGLEAPTLLGETIRFDLSDGVQVNSSSVVAADIEASNGVIHVIDEVLVPQGFALQSVEEDTELPKTGDIGMLPLVISSMIGLAGYAVTRKKW